MFEDLNIYKCGREQKQVKARELSSFKSDHDTFWQLINIISQVQTVG